MEQSEYMAPRVELLKMRCLHLLIAMSADGDFEDFEFGDEL